MPYWIWVPLLVLFYALYTWISRQNNLHGGKWFWITFFYGALCPIWALVSRYSTNLIFDGMLYDVLMFITYAIFMSILGAGIGFIWTQWIGVGFVIAGFALMHLDKDVMGIIIGV